RSMAKSLAWLSPPDIAAFEGLRLMTNPLKQEPRTAYTRDRVPSLTFTSDNGTTMRTEEARPVRLEDYRPPDWLVRTLERDVSLAATATRVRATLRLKPNATAPAPLRLDGDGLNLTGIKLDGAVMAAEHYVATADGLTIAQPPQRPFVLEIETVVDPSANTQ